MAADREALSRTISEAVSRAVTDALTLSPVSIDNISPFLPFEFSMNKEQCITECLYFINLNSNCVELTHQLLSLKPGKLFLPLALLGLQAVVG